MNWMISSMNFDSDIHHEGEREGEERGGDTYLRLIVWPSPQKRKREEKAKQSFLALTCLGTCRSHLSSSCSFASFCLTNLIVAIELIKNNEALTRNTSRCCDCNLGIGRCSSGMSQCMLWPWTMRSSRYVYMRS